MESDMLRLYVCIKQQNGGIMRSLLKYLKDYKKETILAPVFKLLEASFELIVPLVMAAVIDKGIANHDKGYILQMCFIMILLGAIGLICSVTAQFFAAKAATGLSTRLRHEVFVHVQNLSFAGMDTIGTDTLITRMTSDINQVQAGVNLVLRLFLRSPFIVVGAMVMAFTVDVKAALIFVVTIPVLSVIVFGIMVFTMPLYRKVQSGLDQVLRITRENLTGARVIRAFHREEAETKVFETSNQNLTNVQKFAGKISGMMNPLTYIVVNFALIAIIYTGAVRIDTGVLTQGQVIALINYMSQILVELIKLANLIISVTKATVCGNRVAEVLELKAESGAESGNMTKPESMADLTTGNEYAVEFDHVSFAYPGAGSESLRDISFRVKKGQTVGIIGGTGAGKTSLVQLIPGFYPATDGQIKVHGCNVDALSGEELRNHVGMVFQKTQLFKGTIEDNLRWGKEDATMEEMEAALAVSQAKEFVDSKKGGIRFFVEQSGRNLSGGQKQRLTIARAVIKNPDILILDDSASALDFTTDAKLREAIRSIHKNMTVFIVSQRAASIQYADQILVLDEGNLVGKGTHDQLLMENEVYQEIYYSQFPKEEVAG